MSARPEEQHMASARRTGNSANMMITSTDDLQRPADPLQREETPLAHATSSYNTIGPRTLTLTFLLACATLGLLIGLLFMASGCEPTKMMNTLRVLPGYILSQRLLIAGCGIALIGCGIGGAFARQYRISLLRLFETLSSLRAALTRSFLRGDCTGNKVEDTSPARQETTEHVVMQIVAKVLGVPLEHIQRTGDFFEYGTDSRTLNRLLFLLEQRLQVQIKAEDVFDHPTSAQLTTLLMQKCQWNNRHLTSHT